MIAPCWNGNAAVSKYGIVRNPFDPARSDSLNSSQVLPIGVSSPIPVTYTRVLMLSTTTLCDALLAPIKRRRRGARARNPRWCERR